MSFANFITENSNGIQQVEGQLEMARIEIAFENFFCFWEFFNLGRPPTRIRPSKKSLCFSTSLKCAFEPLIIIFRAFSSPYLLSSTPSSPWPSKVWRFLTLPPFLRTPSSLTSLQIHPRVPLSTSLSPFERAFEPSLPFERAFEPSLSPFERAFEPSLLFERAFEPSLSPFERAFEPSLSSSSAFEHLLFSSSAPFSPRFPLRARLWALAFLFECL